jgi:formylglycine-generating enzyme required for sulfatase activity
MPRIFISYRRKSWPFTRQLAEELGQRLDAELFVDFTGVDETDFERAILRNLRDSDAVLLVISEHTFADRIHRDDDWVRREIREALTHHKPLILICVDGLLPPSGLPDDIKDVARMQGINFYPEYFTPGVERLAEFIVKVGAARPRTLPAAPPSPVSGEKSIRGKATLDEALDLLQSGDFHKAIFLLESLQEAGYSPRYVDIGGVLEQARRDAEQADFRRQGALAYEEIAAFARRKVTEAGARTAFEAWSRDYAALVEDLDTENLRERFKPRVSRVLNLLPPPFEWVEIPTGRVTLITEQGWAKNYIPEGKSKVFDVPAFMIAKYPLTNAQYAKFIEAGGYREPRWWTKAGWQQREKGGWTEPRWWQDDQWNGADFPVVGVSWYEAIAFCRWLSEVSGENVLLPTEQQWQRAAQGDDNRAYPWGNEAPNERLCNWNQNIGQTTPVTQYPDGASPYGVMDMSGNVWEWCLTANNTGGTALDGTDVRVLRGGSWWNDNSYNLRAACRNRSAPDNRGSNVGFRCARSAAG